MIRCETPNDRAAIREVLIAAFERPAEADLVEALRASANFDPRLSLVCDDHRNEDNGNVVGHILFTPITVGDAPALALAPLAVLPEHQRRGHGSALVEAGLAAARTLGHGIVVVLGHPEFYSRFGFVPARQHKIVAPFEAPDEAFRVCESLPGTLHGVSGLVQYPAAFLAV